MRLRLTTLALLAATPAAAGDEVQTRVDVYTDGAVEVWAPSVRATVDRGRFRVDGGWTVDVVSGATAGVGVDIVSTATTFDDLRNQADLTVTTRPRSDRAVRVGYTGSVESDYASHAPSVGVTADALDRTATLSAAYRASFESAWTNAGDPLVQRASAHRLDLGWSQILDPSTVLAFAAAGEGEWCGEALGCDASPWRWVPVRWSDASLSLRERHPGDRASAALSAKLSRRVGPIGLHAELGGSGDTWGVWGHDERGAVHVPLVGERLLLSADGRFHSQTAATFWRRAYSGGEAALPGWRTADLELAGLVGGAAGGRAEWSFFDVGPLLRLGVSGRATRQWYAYPDVPLRPRRNAWVFGGGLDAEF